MNKGYDEVKIDRHAATIILSFTDEQNEVWILVVRDNPLTRGWKSSFTRHYHNAVGNVLPVDSCKFPGGSVDEQDKEQLELKKIAHLLPNQPKLILSQFGNSYFNAALRELHEETGIDISSLPINNNCLLHFGNPSVRNDRGRNVALHFFQLDLGKISDLQKTQLFRQIQPGNDIAFVMWYPLSEIQCFQDKDKNVFSLLPFKSPAFKVRESKNYQRVYYSVTADNVRPCVLSTRNRPMSLYPENAQWLEEGLLKRVRIKNFYSPSDILLEEDFEYLKKINEGSSDNWLSRHVPTGKFYVVKHTPPAAQKILLENGNVLKLTVQQAEEHRARNELLTQKLYTLHGILVPDLQLVKYSKYPNSGYLIASRFYPDFKQDNSRLEAEPPDELFDGVGCDIAFLNFDAVGATLTKIPIWGDSRQYNIGFVNNGKNVIRIDLGAGLHYRARGQLKSTNAFTMPIDIDYSFRFDVNRGFYYVYSRQMSIQRWQRSLSCLRSISDAQRQSCVMLYAYGSNEEKLKLATLINHNVASTIQAIVRKIRQLEVSTIQLSQPRATTESHQVETDTSTRVVLSNLSRSSPLSQISVVPSRDNQLDSTDEAQTISSAKEKLSSLLDSEKNFNACYEVIVEKTHEHHDMYLRYCRIYRVVLQNIPTDFSIPPDVLYQDQCHLDMILKRIERNSKFTLIAFINNLRQILQIEYKVLERYPPHRSNDNLMRHPIDQLLQIFDGIEFSNALNLFSERSKSVYCQLLVRQIDRLKEAQEVTFNDIQWLQQQTGKSIEAHDLHDNYRHQNKRLDTLVQFLQSQLLLMRGQYKSLSGKMVDLRSCPEVELTKIFQTRYLIRQFSLLLKDELNQYIDLFEQIHNDLCIQQSYLQKINDFCQHIYQRIQDYRGFEQFRERFRALHRLIENGSEEDLIILAQIEFFYSTLSPTPVHSSSYDSHPMPSSISSNLTLS